MRGEVELEELDSHFAALSHRTRRSILHVMHANGDTMTSGAIASRFDCTWQTTSRHLRILQEAGLIHPSLRGRERIYQLDTSRLIELTTTFADRFRNPPSRA